MLSTSYIIHDIKLLLELNDSARKTLFVILEQFNGELSGKLDRSNMDNAQKQRLKRGVAELKERGFIVKSTDSRARFTINSQLIDTAQVKTREEHYYKSGFYRSDCHELLDILIAIEHFFDEFYNKEFIIKFKIYSNTPRLPAKVFSNMVRFTEDNYLLEVPYFHASVLNELIHMMEQLKHYCDARQQNFVITSYTRMSIIERFQSVINSDFLIYPNKCHAEAKALAKFVQSWFVDNYPEMII
jgi:hypothetical protein